MRGRESQEEHAGPCDNPVIEMEGTVYRLHRKAFDKLMCEILVYMVMVAVTHVLHRRQNVSRSAFACMMYCFHYLAIE